MFKNYIFVMILLILVMITTSCSVKRTFDSNIESCNIGSYVVDDTWLGCLDGYHRDKNDNGYCDECHSRSRCEERGVELHQRHRDRVTAHFDKSNDGCCDRCGFYLH